MKITTNYPATIKPEIIEFNILNELKNVRLDVVFSDIKNQDDYVFMPACAYNGNQFNVDKQPYAPIFDFTIPNINMPVTITDVPRLNIDGSGKIEVSSGDLTTPCVGVYKKSDNKAIFVFTTQGIEQNFGLTYDSGSIKITYPCVREMMYRHCTMVDGTDKYMDFKAGETVLIPYKLIEKDCNSFEEFFSIFFENRKIMKLDTTYGYMPSVRELWEISETKFNDYNYRTKGDYYGVGTWDIPNFKWQLGWVGGGISNYPLLKRGSELSKKRAIKTLEHLFSLQNELGFLVPGYCDVKGSFCDDGFVSDGAKISLTRRYGDALYFLFKHFDIMENVPAEFVRKTKKFAYAICNTIKKYGQLGQFININTGEIVIGGSSSAGIVSAGLVSAYKYFGDEHFLDCAKQVADFHYDNELSKGYTTGGPSEALQCPDSESAFGLLESFVELYDTTREEKYLNRAKFCANLCSSWVVSYNYNFPKTSEFYKKDIKSVGTVWANLQNKHSAPGICTLSGNSLLKLFGFTGEPLYKELILDIAYAIPQFMSTENRPIMSWDEVPIKIQTGVINERVSLSDWEGYNCIGGAFNCSCWPETSLMLTIVEIYDIL